jgi:hypothetical protein
MQYMHIYFQIELRKDDKNLINQYLFCDPSTHIEDFSQNVNAYSMTQVFAHDYKSIMCIECPYVGICKFSPSHEDFTKHLNAGIV